MAKRNKIYTAILHSDPNHNFGLNVCDMGEGRKSQPMPVINISGVYVSKAQFQDWLVNRLGIDKLRIVNIRKAFTFGGELRILI